MFIFGPKGGSCGFLGENADTQNSFFSDFDPIFGLSIYKYIDFHLNYNYKCPNLIFTTPYVCTSLTLCQLNYILSLFYHVPLPETMDAVNKL